MISIVVLTHKNLSITIEQIEKTINSICEQSFKDIEIIFIDFNDLNLNYIQEVSFTHLKERSCTKAAILNKAFNLAKGEFIVLIDLDKFIVLKDSALFAYYFSFLRDNNAAIVYSDYEIVDTNNNLKEVHLLEYHKGRVRDNLDLGKVIVFRKEYVSKVGGLEPTLKFGEIYDLRLKLSEYYNLKLVSNKYNGSLYRVYDNNKKHNVFDYLLQTKEYQLEMENIFTSYLKRIKAYLPPDFNYHEINYKDNSFTKIASIVIPVNNRPEFIGTAIESVINQTIKNIELIIVVNGGKEDLTIPVVKDYIAKIKQPEIKLIVHDINNIGLSLNLGLLQAKGKYYIQLDSDDRLKPNAVEKIIKEFEKDNKVGMVIGSYEVWEKLENGKIVRLEDIPVVTHDEWTEENGRNNLLRINGAGAPRACHIQIIKELGYFGVNDSNYSRNYGEDYELVLKVSEKYKIGRIYEPIYEVIRHKGGTDHFIDQETINRNDNAKDYMRLEAIKRRQELLKVLY